MIELDITTHPLLIDFHYAFEGFITPPSTPCQICNSFKFIVDLSSIATANFDLNRLADDSGYLRTHPEFIESHQVLVNNK